jgi:hypothetical protein
MKTLLVLVFCAAITLNAEPTEQPRPLGSWTETPAKDETFVALMTQAIQIEKEAKAWNDYCLDPDTKGCVEFRDLIATHLTAFIEEALAYNTPGTDCRANLRRRVIAFETKLFKFDLAYGGRVPTTDKDKQDKTKAEAELAAEKAPLEKDLDDCMTSDDQKL